MEISSLSVEPCEGGTLVVTVFEIRKSEIPDFIKREVEFRFLTVLPETLDGKSFDFQAVLCARYSDEEFFNIRCKGNKEIYFQQYGRWNIDKIWRDDVLPCRVYLQHCYFFLVECSFLSDTESRIMYATGRNFNHHASYTFMIPSQSALSIWETIE